MAKYVLYNGAVYFVNEETEDYYLIVNTEDEADSLWISKGSVEEF